MRLHRRRQVDPVNLGPGFLGTVSGGILDRVVGLIRQKDLIAWFESDGPQRRVDGQGRILHQG